MKFDKSVVIINGIVLAIGFFISLGAGIDMAAVGIWAFLIAFVNFVLIVIYSIMGNRTAILNALILAGIAFTIGFSVCSNATGSFH